MNQTTDIPLVRQPPAGDVGAGPGVRARQYAATRRHLVEIGRELFAARGYADVALAEIVTRAGVTKGALYHHFGSKAGLFEAVLAEVQAEVGEAVLAAAAGTKDPWQQLVAGCRAFLSASTDQRARRIMLLDGPVVLGWAQWRAMDDASSARHLREALTGLQADGLVADLPVEPLSRMLSGAMNEAALWLAEAKSPAALAQAHQVLDQMLTATRAPGPVAR